MVVECLNVLHYKFLEAPLLTDSSGGFAYAFFLRSENAVADTGLIQESKNCSRRFVVTRIECPHASYPIKILFRFIIFRGDIKKFIPLEGAVAKWVLSIGKVV